MASQENDNVKCTRGPWVALHGVLLGGHVLIRGDGDYAVAKVYDEEEGMQVVNAANARLIAAAPDMLEVLESDTLNIMLGMIEDSGDAAMWEKARWFMEQRDAVLAKVRVLA